LKIVIRVSHSAEQLKSNGFSVTSIRTFCEELKIFFLGCAPFDYLYSIPFQLNEPGLGAGIDPGIAFDTISI